MQHAALSDAPTLSLFVAVSAPQASESEFTRRCRERAGDECDANQRVFSDWLASINGCPVHAELFAAACAYGRGDEDCAYRLGKAWDELRETYIDARVNDGDLRAAVARDMQDECELDDA